MNSIAIIPKSTPYTNERTCCIFQAKMGLQLYQVDHKSFLLDFKSLNTGEHPDATRVRRMTLASMNSSSRMSDLEDGE